MRNITVRLGDKIKNIILFIFCAFYCVMLPSLADDSTDVASFSCPNNVCIEGYMPYSAKKDETIFSSSFYKIDKIDPTSKTNSEGFNMPGARGTNQLIIYTHNSGESTETNEYGYEAIVVGNTVVDLSGANSPIPENGFVISGHGKAKTWINNAIKIGTKVYVNIDEMRVYTYLTSESYLYLASKKIEETEQMIHYYSQNNPYFNQRFANLYINDAKKYLKKARKNPQAVKKNVSLAIEAANDALKNTVPYKQTEMKGVWIRPVELNSYEIKTTIKNLKRLGVNTIFLETFYHGKTIYPSKLMSTYGFVPQNERFQGFDPLKIWRDECKKEKIELHIWFETFYLGNDNPANNPQHILFLNPSWGNKTKKDYLSINPTKATTEHNGYFLDPANPEVRTFLLDLIREIITNYHPDGINLDYIRYPQAISEMNSWGYTEKARDLFKDVYGKDPVDFSDTASLVEWSNFRRSFITLMVKSVHELCMKHKVYLSTVIFPDRLSALTTKLQDWKEWSRSGYIDGVTPLFLTCDARTASRAIKRVASAISPKTDLFAGIFVTFIGGSPDDLIRQIHETRKLDLNGVVLFDYAHTTNRYADVLTMFFKPKDIAVPNNNEKDDSDGKALESSKKEKKKFWGFFTFN